MTAGFRYGAEKIFCAIFLYWLVLDYSHLMGSEYSVECLIVLTWKGVNNLKVATQHRTGTRQTSNQTDLALLFN